MKRSSSPYPVRMAPTYTADLHIPGDDLQYPAGSHLLRSSDFRPECKNSQPKRSNRTSDDWRPRLRSRSSRPAEDPARPLCPNLKTKTFQASPSSGIAPSAKKAPAGRPSVAEPSIEQPSAKKPSIKQPLVKKPPANKRSAKNRKAPDGTRPRTTKTKAPRNSENTKGHTEGEELWPVKPSDRVKPNSNNGTLNYLPYTTLQDPTYKGDKRTQRKRQASSLEDPEDNRVPISKRPKTIKPIRPLTRKNLELLENSMDPSLQSKSGPALSKRSDYTAPSSRLSAASSRSLSASNIRFEWELKALNVDYTAREKPDLEEVRSLLKVMERDRDSPEPDSKLFHEIRCVVRSENEASITQDLSPLLLVRRKLPSNNHKTSNLLYRADTSWGQWGSAQPGRLPVPKPDLCISYKASAFNLDEQQQICSPYLDTAGFAPFLICEVKTALQGDEIADRQNANNVLHVLKADFKLQQTLGRDRAMERKVRVITTAHNTRTQWYQVWFYIFGDDGNPKWCSYLFKRISFDCPEENGFQTARGCFLNLCEHFDSVVLPKLRADLAEASTLGLSSLNGAPFQPVLTQAPGLPVQANTPLSTESLLDDNDDAAADVQPASKRAKATTRPAAPSKAKAKRGNPRSAEGTLVNSNRVNRRGRDTI